MNRLERLTERVTFRSGLIASDVADLKRRLAATFAAELRAAFKFLR